MSAGRRVQPWAGPPVPQPVKPTGWKVLTHSDVQRPSFLLGHGADFCHRVSQVRGEGPIDVRLQLKKQKGERTNCRAWKS